MFKYGRTAGILSIVLVVLAIVPLLAAISYVPGMPDQVAMKVSAAGEVERWGSKWEMLVVPALCLVFSLATYANAGKQAGQHDSEAMSRAVALRYLRNGIITAVVLNIANAYVLYMAVTGKGIGF